MPNSTKLVGCKLDRKTAEKLQSLSRTLSAKHDKTITISDLVKKALFKVYKKELSNEK